MYIRILKKTPSRKFPKLTIQAITFQIRSKNYGKTKLQITNVFKKSMTFVIQTHFFLFEFHSKINPSNIHLSGPCTSHNLES